MSHVHTQQQRLAGHVGWYCSFTLPLAHSLTDVQGLRLLLVKATSAASGIPPDPHSQWSQGCTGAQSGPARTS